VEAFDISTRDRDFGTLRVGMMISDGIIDWMLNWWTTQIGGGTDVNAEGGLTQTAPHLPKCYYVPSKWFTKLTEDGRVVHQKVSRWTVDVNILRDYDLMFIPIIHVFHWYLKGYQLCGENYGSA
jgi:Ulp1 family protease